MSASFSGSRTTAWTIWMVVSLFYAYQYLLRVMPNVLLYDIIEQFHIGAATFGQFSGVYYIGYSLMHLPLGIMLDRYGPKRVISCCILLSVLSLLPLLFATHWAYPILGRFMLGLGSSAAILGVFKIIRMTFNQEQFPRMLSFSVTIGLIGAIYGGAPMNYMYEVLGYQCVIRIFALLGVALAVMTYLLIPQLKKPSEGSVASAIKEVLRNRKVVWSCLFAGLMVGPLEGFADVWGTTFLKQVYGFNGTLAASISSMIFIGMCFGAPVLSFVADKIGSYLVTIIGAGIAMAASFFLFLLWHPSAPILYINFTIVGVCCAYQILAIYKASTYVREQVAGLTTAIANMIIMTFGYTFHTLIGGVITLMGGPTAPQALFYGIAVIPLALCLGSLGFTLLLSQEKRNKLLTT